MDNETSRLPKRWPNKEIKQKKVAILWLRTGHNSLKHHMFKLLKIGETDLCECGEEKQDTNHVLQICQQYQSVRETLRPQPISEQSFICLFSSSWRPRRSCGKSTYNRIHHQGKDEEEKKEAYTNKFSLPKLQILRNPIHTERNNILFPVTFALQWLSQAVIFS